MSEKEKEGSPDFAWIRGIADAMREQGAEELEVSIPDQNFSLYIRLSHSVGQVTLTPENEEEDDPFKDRERYERVESPLTGAFYRKPDPTSPPYVSEGDYVEVGQILCMVEANKTFNNIGASVSGVVVQIMPEDKSPVRKGDVLMIIDMTKGPPKPSYMR